MYCAFSMDFWRRLISIKLWGFFFLHPSNVTISFHFPQTSIWKREQQRQKSWASQMITTAWQAEARIQGEHLDLPSDQHSKAWPIICWGPRYPLVRSWNWSRGCAGFQTLWYGLWTSQQWLNQLCHIVHLYFHLVSQNDWGTWTQCFEVQFTALLCALFGHCSQCHSSTQSTQTRAGALQGTVDWTLQAKSLHQSTLSQTTGDLRQYGFFLMCFLLFQGKWSFPRPSVRLCVLDQGSFPFLDQYLNMKVVGMMAWINQESFLRAR